MPESQVYRRGAARVGFNMTPMIDVVFQLIIFFMLTTQMVSEEYPRMELPHPTDPVPTEVDSEAIINVLPYPDEVLRADASKLGKAKEYRVMKVAVRPEELGRLIRELKGLKSRSRNPADFSVEVRADRRVHYNQIQPVLRALQEAGLPKMRITEIKTPTAG